MDDQTDPHPNPHPRKKKAIPLSGWKIRFDSPPRRRDAALAGSGDILALFQSWYESNQGVVTPDRRTTPRYTPESTKAWIGWWKKGSFRVANAEILNLSKGGALVHLDSCPPTCQPVWVCLGTPSPVDFVQARVLDPKGEGDVVFLARLEFHTPCPPSFFLAAGFCGEEKA